MSKVMGNFLPINRKVFLNLDFDSKDKDVLVAKGIFIDLLMKARHQKSELKVFLTSKKEVTLKQGQLIVEWKDYLPREFFHYNRAQKIIRQLENIGIKREKASKDDPEVTRNTHQKKEVLTIENYLEIQGSVTHQLHTSDNSVTIGSQNDNDNKDLSPLRKNKKDKKDKKNTFVDFSAAESPHEKILKLWNENCGSLPKVKKLTKLRVQKIKLRLSDEPDLGYWEKCFSELTKSSFIQSSSWCSFDWVIKNESNHVKLAEGTYSDKDQTRASEFNCDYCKDNKRVALKIKGETKIQPCPKCQKQVTQKTM
jgi:hypothetical protein